MPGAWEMLSLEVDVAILTRETVTMQWALSLRALQLPAKSSVNTYSGMPFDHARNAACYSALQRNAEWLFFLDDDVAVPPDAFHRLASHKQPIVSGLYYRRNSPIAPVALRDTPQGPVFATDIVAPSLSEVDLIGGGCLLIHNSVLRTIPHPWFEWLVDRTELSAVERCSEDFAFCRKARRNYGFKIYIDTSVQCRHIGLGFSSFGGVFAPLDGK